MIKNKATVLLDNDNSFILVKIVEQAQTTHTKIIRNKGKGTNPNDCEPLRSIGRKDGKGVKTVVVLRPPFFPLNNRAGQPLVVGKLSVHNLYPRAC